jgi:hypothetical protein
MRSPATTSNPTGSRAMLFIAIAAALAAQKKARIVKGGK